MAAKEVRFSVDARDEVLRSVDILSMRCESRSARKAGMSCSTSRLARRVLPRMV